MYLLRVNGERLGASINYSIRPIEMSLPTVTPIDAQHCYSFSGLQGVLCDAVVYYELFPAVRLSDFWRENHATSRAN